MASPTRLLVLIPSLVANGAERQLCELVKHMDRERFEVHVGVFYPPGGNEGDFWGELDGLPGVALHCLHKRRGPLGYLTALPRLLRLAWRLQPEVVHGYLDGNLPALLVGGLMRLPVVWGVRSSSVDAGRLDRYSRFLLQLMVRCSRFVDLVIFNSSAGLASHARIGLKARRMEVVRNGFDIERFRPEPALGAARRQAWGVPPEAPLIGIAGRLQPVKDHPTFLRAAARVAESRPDCWFVCVGDGPEDYKAALKAQAAASGLAGRVLFPGACDDMPGAYNALTGFCLASREEGFPNVLGEAMACGVPCVSTRVGDAEQLLGSLGATVPAGDDAALAAALVELLGEDPADRAGRRQALRDRVVECFSVNALARATENLLLDVAGKAPAGGHTGTTSHPLEGHV
jgi:glycosyltransferase involved in cell wall biosynthesis